MKKEGYPLIKFLTDSKMDFVIEQYKTEHQLPEDALFSY